MYACCMEFISHLTSVDRERLIAEGEVQRLSAGEYLLRRGQRGGDMYLVEAGRLEVVDIRQSPEVILDVLGVGRVVGEMAFVDGSERAADVRALDDAVVRHWSREGLHRMLESDASLRARFYLAISAAAVGRLRASGSHHSGGGIGAPNLAALGGVSAAVVEEARNIAGVARNTWARTEQAVRREPPDQKALQDAENALLDLVENVESWLGSLNSVPRAQEAGMVLRTELRHWLIRSRTGLLGVDRRSEQGNRLRFLAHMLLGRPQGVDVVGERLDGVFLGLPSPVGLRLRMLSAVDAVVESLPNDRPAKIAIIQPSCGALLARLLPRIIANGATIRCIDGDSQTLNFVDAGLQTRPAGIQIEMIHQDLVALSEGQSVREQPKQDVIVINGLIDHLPARLVGSLLKWCKEHLVDSGRIIATAMKPTSDARAMEHLLSWPLVRRTADDLSDLFYAAGLHTSVIPTPSETAHSGLVISATLSANGQD